MKKDRNSRSEGEVKTNAEGPDDLNLFLILDMDVSSAVFRDYEELTDQSDLVHSQLYLPSS